MVSASRHVWASSCRSYTRRWADTLAVSAFFCPSARIVFPAVTSSRALRGPRPRTYTLTCAENPSASRARVRVYSYPLCRLLVGMICVATAGQSSVMSKPPSPPPPTSSSHQPFLLPVRRDERLARSSCFLCCRPSPRDVPSGVGCSTRSTPPRFVSTEQLSPPHSLIALFWGRHPPCSCASSQRTIRPGQKSTAACALEYLHEEQESALPSAGWQDVLVRHGQNRIWALCEHLLAPTHPVFTSCLSPARQGVKLGFLPHCGPGIKQVAHTARHTAQPDRDCRCEVSKPPVWAGKEWQCYASGL